MQIHELIKALQQIVCRYAAFWQADKKLLQLQYCISNS